ncbi:tripartite tricarboxylate transporter substrate binding protein [Delftia tsuruhatensis]|uniref:Tripartite tricarboxylate transporter substrate binding protein n=3 Tax=Pseudomonadota TaxID=1224 RepID=A0AAX3SFK6_9BURK|nr:tripartite tricarboxylate transporter substrate binding protein [Delftia tsuruhatensis]AOV00287.1 twin-arginine translocation pathway signal [Delftia tsuruhatensis]MDH2231547.1 tripartite tricarboxylate transporter substrate binding protein [Delftia tsuruhatensis]WFF78835.1 tripartite tricarboxylate transporter substrate binding protein [Delftia tsuruhatensis]
MQRHHFLRAALSAAAGAALLALAGPAGAQAWPAKPVRVVIPFPPGGTLDAVGRQLAQKLGEQTGQQFIIDNRPGGNGVIGGDIVAKAPADGYTLLFNASTFTTAPMTMKTVPYQVNRDFAPVALVAKAPLSVAINKNLPITDIKSLMAYAKSHPGKMTFAVGSIGSAGHLSTELLKRAGQLDYLIVPYKGTAPAFQDLIGGQIDGFIDPILGSLQYHKGGMLRVVAVTSVQRAPSLPDVPTVGETIAGYEFYSWYGLWAPAKVPADIIKRLNTEVNKALAGDLKDKLREQGLLLSPGSVEDFARFQASDMERAQKIVTEGNIRVE